MLIAGGGGIWGREVGGHTHRQDNGMEPRKLSGHFPPCALNGFQNKIHKKTSISL